jgi:hypothetical protein
VFDKVKKNCPRCRAREACAIDLRHDPNGLIWEAYCPNSEVLNAMVALTEAGASWALLNEGLGPKPVDTPPRLTLLTDSRRRDWRRLRQCAQGT